MRTMLCVNLDSNVPVADGSIRNVQMHFGQRIV